ncbi:MAG: glycine cleavage system protein GcvH [Candidatus Zixiibacteriota bacterium]|nr:MAG: glycine cleavage system protein GcvH [candidate division Zixibacteria bacterium]
MDIPANLLYAKTHEWIRIEGDLAVVGITDFAQGELGDIVYVQLPQPGQTVDKGAAFGNIEAVKAVSDLYAPVSGEVVEINGALEDGPEAINTSPYDQGWMIKIRMANPADKDDLLNAEQYQATLGEH